MHQTLEHQIRERAYHLWLQNGCGHGEADQHWLTAEREMLANFAASSRSAQAAKPAKRPGRRRAA
ncbi:MAG TPA: DUF2934 domain-containing protein [Xanthobacteraceae bacterium]|nr:DUF2934 domain-containing protein [Xanthobacteraceae bacterium]